ncbi:hypothetical protein ACGFIV_32575 [Sphaerisporangium sp. NPDC049003]|uniref:hypothetical protein n=1 Tax=Sphaerisporangium sp. NPDC049003 TaxID=3364517 RepID=UPI0037134493
MRILIDGLDMAGKTTLVRALIAEFASRGISATRHRGMLAEHHPLEQVLRQLSSARQPDSWWTTTAYLVGGFALDSLLVRFDPPRPYNAVIIQDGYADRTVAFGMAGGPYLAAALFLRWPKLLAPFDLAIYLHASPAARAKRIAGRDYVDCRDVRSVQDSAFAERFHAFHVHGMGRRHRRLLVVDSSDRKPGDMARVIADEAFALTRDGSSVGGRLTALRRDLPPHPPRRDPA